MTTYSRRGLIPITDGHLLSWSRKIAKTQPKMWSSQCLHENDLFCIHWCTGVAPHKHWSRYEDTNKIKKTPFFLQLYSIIAFPLNANMELMRNNTHFSELIKFDPNINVQVYCLYKSSEPIVLAISQALLDKLKCNPFITAWFSN